jgi:bifunctional NMN adenylyltransferase/nudix hydrolase
MTTAVIIGRFQVPELHKAHEALIDWTRLNFDKVIVMIGCSEVPSAKNPLTYEQRADMIHRYVMWTADERPVKTYQLMDAPSYGAWSGALDLMLRTVTSDRDIVLVGGRDSFIPKYSGKHKTMSPPEHIFEGIADLSGTAIREAISKEKSISPLFHKGYIKAHMDDTPKVLSTVDIAVIYRHSKGRSILLGHKQVNDGWRLPGGFVDGNDETLEAAAIRELKEETGLEFDWLHPLFSRKISDWRFRDSSHGIMTHVFMAVVEEPVAVEAKDDLRALRWFDVDNINLDVIADAHKPLMVNLKQRLGEFRCTQEV